MQNFIHKLTLYNRFLLVISFILYKLDSSWSLSQEQLLVVTLLMFFQIGIAIILNCYKKEVERKWINRLNYYLTAVVIYGFIVLGNHYKIINFDEVLRLIFILLTISFTLILESINEKTEKRKRINNITKIAWVNRVLMLTMFICLLMSYFTKESPIFLFYGMITLFFIGVFQLIVFYKEYSSFFSNLVYYNCRVVK